MAISPAVRPGCCAYALVPRASKPVPTAPAAANPVFRKLRRFRGLLLTFVSFFMVLLLQKGLDCGRSCPAHAPISSWPNLSALKNPIHRRPRWTIVLWYRLLTFGVGMPQLGMNNEFSKPCR